MNIALHNPYTRICRAEVSEFPDQGSQTPPPPSPAPGTTPADTTPPSGASTPPPPAASESSGDVDFTLTPAVPEATPAESPPPGEPNERQPPEQQETPYTLELPEDFEATEEFKTLLTEQARESGLDGKAAGKYVSGVIAAMQQAEKDNIAASTRQLRNDWGKDFQSNMQAVKQFSGKLMAKSGLTPEDMAPLQSPKGYRLLHSLMKTVGESTYVKGTAAPILDPITEAHRMLTDSTHPDYPIMQDPTHPRFHEINRKYNRLVGLPE